MKSLGDVLVRFVLLLAAWSAGSVLLLFLAAGGSWYAHLIWKAVQVGWGWR